jgi:hypothetical protein
LADGRSRGRYCQRVLELADKPLLKPLIDSGLAVIAGDDPGLHHGVLNFGCCQAKEVILRDAKPIVCAIRCRRNVDRFYVERSVDYGAGAALLWCAPSGTDLRPRDEYSEDIIFMIEAKM